MYEPNKQGLSQRLEFGIDSFPFPLQNQIKETPTTPQPSPTQVNGLVALLREYAAMLSYYQVVYDLDNREIRKLEELKSIDRNGLTSSTFRQIFGGNKVDLIFPLISAMQNQLNEKDKMIGNLTEKVSVLETELRQTIRTTERSPRPDPPTLRNDWEAKNSETLSSISHALENIDKLEKENRNLIQGAVQLKAEREIAEKARAAMEKICERMKFEFEKIQTQNAEFSAEIIRLTRFRSEDQFQAQKMASEVEATQIVMRQRDSELLELKTRVRELESSNRQITESLENALRGQKEKEALREFTAEQSLNELFAEKKKVEQLEDKLFNANNQLKDLEASLINAQELVKTLNFVKEQKENDIEALARFKFPDFGEKTVVVPKAEPSRAHELMQKVQQELGTKYQKQIDTLHKKLLSAKEEETRKLQEKADTISSLSLKVSLLEKRLEDSSKTIRRLEEMPDSLLQESIGKDKKITALENELRKIRADEIFRGRIGRLNASSE